MQCGQSKQVGNSVACVSKEQNFLLLFNFSVFKMLEPLGLKISKGPKETPNLQRHMEYERET